MKGNKRILWIMVSVILVAGLAACGVENKEVFSVNGETFTYTDVTAYGYIFAKENHITDREILKETYEDRETYGDYYKRQMEEEIVEMMLLCQEAEENHLKLSKEEEEKVKTKTEALLDSEGKENLKEQGISDADIENIYEMQMLAASYIKKYSEEETGEAPEKENRYVKVYQVIFPTAVLDEEGMVQSDQEGSLKRIPQTEIEKKKEEASEFAQKAQAGEAIEELLKDYDKTVTGMEKYLKYSDLETSYKKAVDSLSEGETSDSFETDYGYYVIRLLESDAAEYGQMLTDHEEALKTESKAEEEISRLYSRYIENNSEYKNKELWNQVEMEQFVR